MKRALAAVALLAVVTAPVHARAAGADGETPKTEVSKNDKDEARARFERGLGFYRQKQLEAALAEFLRSRKLYPTRAASFNTARVYKELGRYDEALEALESIPKQFPDLSGTDKDDLDRELRDVKGRIGFVVVTPSEADATIVI